MTYLYKKSNSSPKLSLKSIGLGLVVLFFILIKFTILGDVFYLILSPLFSLGDNMYQNIDDIPEKFWSKDKLLQEVGVLREKEKELNLKLSDISALQSENREFRNGLKIKPEQEFVSAFVIARPPQVPFDTLLINKGLEVGVKVGDLLLVSDSIMIGKVIEVREYSSLVLLNSSPSAYFTANISRNNEPIEVFGRGSGNLYAKLPIVTDLEIGDVIVLNYGKVFSIGIVKEIEEEEISGFKHAFISLPVNVSSLGLVFITSHLSNSADSINEDPI